MLTKYIRKQNSRRRIRPGVVMIDSVLNISVRVARQFQQKSHIVVSLSFPSPDSCSKYLTLLSIYVSYVTLQFIMTTYH